MADHEINLVVKAKNLTGSTFSSLSKSITGINQALEIAKKFAKALKEAYDEAKEGASLLYAEERFDNLAASIGTVSDALLGDMKEATRGLVSDSELVASAADFMGLGLAKTHDEVVRLTTVAGALGMNMNQLVLTLTNQTTMRFDALGVSVDGFDEKVRALKDSGMDANEAFTEAFLQQAEEQITKVGDVADTTMGTFQKMDASVKNLGDSIKVYISDELAKNAIPLITEFFDALNTGIQASQITSQINDVTEKLKELGYTEKEIFEMSGMSKRFYFFDDVTLLEEGTRALEILTWQIEQTGYTVDTTAESLIAEAIAAKQAGIDTQSVADATNNASSAMQGYTEKLLFNIASEGLSSEAALNLAYAMGLVDEKTVYATEKINEYKALLDAGKIDVETYTALVKGLGDSLDGLPSDVSVNVSMALESDDVDRYLANLVRSVTVPVFFQPHGGGYPIPEAAGGPIQAAAAGLSGMPAYKVGEIGPELFFPAVNGRVVSNSEAKASLRSGGGGGETIVVNINTPMNFADKAWVERELAPYITKAIRSERIRG